VLPQIERPSQTTTPSAAKSGNAPTGESTTGKGEPLVPYKIAITGHIRTGKDTFADMLVEALSPPTSKLHFADALKYEVAHMLYDYRNPAHRDRIVTSGVHKETYLDSIADFAAEMAEDRQLNGLAWQWLGEWRRQKTSPDYWIDHFQFQDVYREALAANSNIIIADVRHVNEAEWCRKEGFYLVRIVGPCRAEGERRDPTHASEVHIDELEVDLVLPNTGSLNTLKEIAEGMPSRIALTHAPHYYLAKNNA
jgi:hypothetical protein